METDLSFYEIPENYTELFQKNINLLSSGKACISMERSKINLEKFKDGLHKVGCVEGENKLGLLNVYIRVEKNKINKVLCPSVIEGGLCESRVINSVGKINKDTRCPHFKIVKVVNSPDEFFDQ